eukprot:15345728-Ditylum_brightwellii.AAC.1
MHYPILDRTSPFVLLCSLSRETETHTKGQECLALQQLSSHKGKKWDPDFFCTTSSSPSLLHHLKKKPLILLLLTLL